MEVAKNFLIDTVVLARYLEVNLPSPASDIFSLAQRGEASILVPQIVMEGFIYIAMKGRLRLTDSKRDIKKFLDELRGASFIPQSNFPEDGWDIFFVPRYSRATCQVNSGRGTESKFITYFQ